MIPDTHRNTRLNQTLRFFPSHTCAVTFYAFAIIRGSNCHLLITRKKALDDWCPLSLCIFYALFRSLITDFFVCRKGQSPYNKQDENWLQRLWKANQYIYLGVVRLYHLKLYLKCISDVCISLRPIRKYNYTYKTNRKNISSWNSMVLMQAYFFYLLELESRISTF